MGIEVVGVSGDTAKTQGLFKKQHKLNFTLLGDDNGDVAKKFGVPVSKGGEITVKDLDNLKVKRGVTESRWTFVIGKDGKILFKNTKGDVANEAKNVLDVIGKESK